MPSELGETQAGRVMNGSNVKCIQGKMARDVELTWPTLDNKPRQWHVHTGRGHSLHHGQERAPEDAWHLLGLRDGTDLKAEQDRICPPLRRWCKTKLDWN